MSSAVIGNANEHIRPEPHAITRLAPRSRATRLRITTRGRAVLATIVAAPFVMLALVFAGGGVAMANGESGSNLRSVTVLSGQNLWQVAEQVAPQADPREVIADLLSVNSLETAEVFAGQLLEIPSEYSR